MAEDSMAKAAEAPLADNVVQAAPSEIASLLRWQVGDSFSDVDSAATPGFDGGKSDGREALSRDAKRLGELQELLFANAQAGSDERRLLLVIQGRDTAGKGGIVKHVVGCLSPHGVHTASFGVPDDEERKHHYLWRIREELPAAGQVGVFDRSHYEDILAARMHRLVPVDVWDSRYGELNDFEAELVGDGISVLKVLLTISKEEQYGRLRKRLVRADKLWKFSPGDIDDRLRWDEYTQAFQDVLDRTDRDSAPWYVIPADRKWYARWAVSRLLIHHLSELDQSWPQPEFDRDTQLARLEEARTL